MQVLRGRVEPTRSKLDAIAAIDMEQGMGRRDKNTGSKAVENWQKELAKVPQMSWGAARKIQLALIRKVEAKKKERQTSTKPPLSPLGQRPKLDADHLPFPKAKRDE